MRRKVNCPSLNQRIQFLVMRNALLQVSKARIREPFRMVRDLAESLPFFLSLNRDHAPAVVAFAPIAAMRRGPTTEIPLRLGLAGVDEAFQIRGPDHGSGGFGLREINVLALARARAVVERRQNRERTERRSDVIRKGRLGARARALYAWIPPEISHAGIREQDRTEAQVLAPRSGVTERLKAGHDDVGAQRAHPRVIELPARHYPGTEILGQYVCRADQFCRDLTAF